MERERQPRQDDVNDDDAQTAPAASDEFVGEAAGQDVGYAGETGAERRAKWEAEQGS